MDGEAGWWTTSGNIGLPPLARVMGVGRQQQQQVMVYADDIRITSTHTSTSAAKKYIQPYLHKVFAWTKQNNLILNPDKTTCTLVHTRPCRIYEQSGPNNKQQSTTHGNSPKGSGSYLRPKTHIQHTHPQHLNTRTQTSSNHKTLTATGWGKQKETPMTTYEAVI